MTGCRKIARVVLCALAMLVASLPAVADERSISVEIKKGKMVRLDRPAASVIVADPGTADVQVVSPKLIFVQGKKIGQTSLYAVDAQDDPVLNLVVDVTHDISQLERTVRQVVPDAEVGFKTVDGGLVLDGYTRTVAEAEHVSNVASAFVGTGEKMVNMIKTAGSDQVMLKVKIVEMVRSDLKRFGINLQNVTQNGSFAWQLLQGNDILYHTAEENVFAFSTPGSVLARQGSLDSNFLLHYKDISGLVNALETQGLATVLAEPTLTTTTGKAASFLAGGQFPLPVLGADNTVTIQYQPFGVSLNFTPVVMSKDRISLTVAPEVSTLNFNNPIQVQNITYPILNTRKASAVVELGSGDSFMLAGLLQHDNTNSVNKFPGLGDVPILGALFRSQQFQNNQTELVILVTPYLVRPVTQTASLQTPVDGYKPPSDLQRLLTGNLYQQQPMAEEEKILPPAEDMPQLHGDGGFMLE